MDVDRRAEAKRQVRIAEQALEQGDPKHAAHHAASAMMYAPLDEGVLAMVDHLIDTPAPGLGAALGRLFGGSKDVAPLFPDDGFAGNIAVRARAHEKRDELAEAFGLVVSLALSVPEKEFLDWAHQLASSGNVDARHYLGVYSELVGSTIGLLWLRPGEQRFFEGWTSLGLALLDGVDEENRRSLKMVVSGIARRAGRYEDAARLAQSESPEPFLDTARGLALRALRRTGDACAAFERAATVASQPEVYALEVGRALFDAGRYREARDAMRKATELHDEEKVALSTLDEILDPDLPRLYTRLFGPEPEYDAIRRFITGQDVHRGMSDASTNVIPQLEDKPPPFDVKLTVTCLEAPSAIATLALRTQGAPDPCQVTYDYGGTSPTPHPFEVRDRHLGMRLWQKEGELVRQALEPPPDEVSAFVDGVVRDHWVRDGESMPIMSEDRVWKLLRAREDLVEIPAVELFAAMVHPTAPPEWPVTAAWVFDRQVVCALALAARAWDRPWLGSERRENLAGLIHGHPDWTLAAGLIALRQVVLDDPDALEDARAWARMLVNGLPDQGHCAWKDALRVLVQMPGMPPELDAKLAEEEGGEEGEEE